jgi:predicted metalloendopeptidase
MTSTSKQRTNSVILGASYIETVFGDVDRLEANQLISNLRQIFHDNLDLLPWIDTATKAEARRKLMRIRQKIGFPDLISNVTELTERYGRTGPMRENQFFDNALQALARDRRRSLLRFGEPVNRNE